MDDDRATIQAMVEMPGFRQSMFLVSHGVPYDVALSLSEIERTAYYIAVNEALGGRFDFDRWRWVEKE